MSKLTRYRAYDSPSDARITDLSNPLIPRVRRSSILTFPRSRFNTTPIQLVANVDTKVLPMNPLRSVLIIQNKDAAAQLFVGLGNSLGINGIQIQPLGSMFLDYECPDSDIYLFALANIQATVAEASKPFQMGPAKA